MITCPPPGVEWECVSCNGYRERLLIPCGRKRLIDLDQMPVWVAEVNGADAPIGMVAGFGEQGHAMRMQMLAKLVHAFDGEGQADGVLHFGLYGFGRCAEGGAHFGFVE